jgi:hypothetical protein
LASGSASDSYLDNAFLYVLPDTTEPNQGAYGNTTHEATENPAQHIALRFPDLYVDWERNRPLSIRWDSYNNLSESLVRIDLLQDDPVHGPAVLLTLAASTPDDGEFTWIPQSNGINFGTYGLRVQITVLDNPTVFDRSTEPFTVPEAGTNYWVDDASNANDEYTPGGVGSNRNTGKLATAPKPNPVNVLRIYDLSAGNTLFVDTGVYPLIHNVRLSTNPLLGFGLDEGFLFTGPTDTAKVARLTAAIPGNVNQVLVELNDADFVTLRHLTMDWARYGIWVHNNSTNFNASYLKLSNHLLDGFRLESEAPTSVFHHLTISNNGGDGMDINAAIGGVTDSELFNNTGTGLRAVNVGNAVFEANDIYGNKEYGVFLSGGNTGTFVTFGNANLALGRGNTVHGNGNTAFGGARAGIQVSGNVRVVGNTVYGHHNGYAGIRGSVGLSGEVSRNLVYDNFKGIDIGGGTAAGIRENRVYFNETTGIIGRGVTVERNVVYSNGIGIEATGSVFTLRNNVVYANSTFGIFVQGGGAGSRLILNNTIYQTQGAAVRVEAFSQDVTLRNNILAVTSGVALSVSSDSQVGFHSDDNLFFLSGPGIAAS